MKSITIGITDCSKFVNYERWLAAENIKIIKLSPEKNNLSDLEKCDGVVLSGGEDVHPKYYGHPEWMERKKELKLDVNEVRDEFEMKVIDRAYKQKTPMLGICRGLQIANVYFKGTLIPDLTPNPSPTTTEHEAKVGSEARGRRGEVQHSKESNSDKIHIVKIEDGSCLNGIILSDSGNVNSAHHQAADKVGEGLKVTARAHDGTIEALELKDPTQHPFLLLVQWHPERMEDQESGLSKNIREKFLEAVKKTP